MQIYNINNNCDFNSDFHLKVLKNTFKKSKLPQTV